MTAGPKAGRWIWRWVCGGELGGAHWFHFQGPRMKDQELEGRILEGLIARVSGMAPGRVRALSFLTVSHLLWNQGSSLKTQSLVPLSLPHPGPGVKAQGLCGSQGLQMILRPSTSHSGPG